MSDTKPIPSQTVLIGDPSQERFNLLEKILREKFDLFAIRFPNFQALSAKVKEDLDWKLVIYALDLPFSAKLTEQQPMPDMYAESLTAELMPLVCIGDDERGPKLPSNIRYLCLAQQPSPESRDEVIGALRTFAAGFPPKVRLPELELHPNDDRTLREQIRSLSEDRDIDEGKDILKHVVNLFFNNRNITIERLGQGLSGAKVFLLHIEEDSETQSYAFKLARREFESKLEKEVRKHEQARTLTQVSSLRSYLPELQPCLNNQRHPYIASYSNWSAVCYHYLGGDKKDSGKKVGKIIDLETLLICSLDELQTKTNPSKLHARHFNSGSSLFQCRGNLFAEFLDWLCDDWCSSNGGIRRANHQLWLPDAPGSNWEPYELSGRDEGRIFSFLDSKDAGKVSRLLPEWQKHRDRVWEFIEQKGHLNGQTALNRLMPVTMALVHGDMNSNNVMLWMEYIGHMLLIDMPFFQESGHAMQDFARLEIEIIYALMDCQNESAETLPASDYTHTQLRYWIQLMDHLLDENDWKKKPSLSKNNLTANARHCFDLIRLLRLKAYGIQQMCNLEIDEMPSFFAEYLPALLYYTLKEIGYESRTVFKRLLAVYSASQILARLETL